MVDKIGEKADKEPKKFLTRIAEYFTDTQQEKEYLFYEKAQKARDNFYFDVISERVSDYDHDTEEIRGAVDIFKELAYTECQFASWVELCIETELTPSKSKNVLKILTEEAGLLDVDELKVGLHEDFNIYSLSKDGKELKKAMSVY